MKMIMHYAVGLLLLSASAALGQEGILPGEPDPNTSPRADNPTAENCPKGLKHFQKTTCSPPNEKLICPSPSPVMECSKKAKRPKCKKPLVPVPLFKCE